MTAADVVVEYIAEHGPATVPEMADACQVPSEVLRAAVYKLRQDGELVRFGDTSPTDVHGRPCGGHRAVLWAFPEDVE